MCSVHSPTSRANKSSFAELAETLVYINLENIIIGDARTDDLTDYIWDTTALDNLSDDIGITEPMKMYNSQEDGSWQDAGYNNFDHALIDFSVSVFGL